MDQTSALKTSSSCIRLVYKKHLCESFYLNNIPIKKDRVLQRMHYNFAYFYNLCRINTYKLHILSKSQSQLFQTSVYIVEKTEALILPNTCILNKITMDHQTFQEKIFFARQQSF